MEKFSFRYPMFTQAMLFVLAYIVTYFTIDNWLAFTIFFAVISGVFLMLLIKKIAFYPVDYVYMDGSSVRFYVSNGYEVSTGIGDLTMKKIFFECERQKKNPNSKRYSEDWWARKVAFRTNFFDHFRSSQEIVDKIFEDIKARGSYAEFEADIERKLKISKRKNKSISLKQIKEIIPDSMMK